jgi:hypothetical protein
MQITLRNKTKKDTQIKFCKVIAASMLMYGSESWAPNRSEKRETETAEMNSLRFVAGYVFTYIIRQYTMHYKYML